MIIWSIATCTIVATVVYVGLPAIVLFEVYNYHENNLLCAVMHVILIQDLAARNVLMDKNESCKVSDFGLLRKASKDESENYSYMMQVSKLQHITS